MCAVASVDSGDVKYLGEPVICTALVIFAPVAVSAAGRCEFTRYLLARVCVCLGRAVGTLARYLTIGVWFGGCDRYRSTRTSGARLDLDVGLVPD